MSDYLDTLREHARIAILRLLEEAPKYTSNVAMITPLLQDYGIGFTRDQVEGEAAWLAEQGLVTRTELSSGLVVLTTTQRGLDVAQGTVRHPGVRRPSPDR
jgi:Fe2+ or Zn2+ uptake regulation protein